MHYSRCDVIGKGHRLGPARAKGLKKINSTHVALKRPDTSHCPKSQGKSFFGWRHWWPGLWIWKPVPIDKSPEYRDMFCSVSCGQCVMGSAVDSCPFTKSQKQTWPHSFRSQGQPGLQL